MPTQYSSELIGQRRFKLGSVELLVTAWVEPPKQSSSKKAHKRLLCLSFVTPSKVAEPFRRGRILLYPCDCSTDGHL